jgi:hypothetical protein
LRGHINEVIEQRNRLEKTNDSQCDKINEMKVELKDYEKLSKSKDERINKIKCERDDLRLKLLSASATNDDEILDRFQDFVSDISKNILLDSMIDTKNKREALLQLIKKYFK